MAKSKVKIEDGAHGVKLGLRVTSKRKASSEESEVRKPDLKKIKVEPGVESSNQNSSSTASTKSSRVKQTKPKSKAPKPKAGKKAKVCRKLPSKAEVNSSTNIQDDKMDVKSDQLSTDLPTSKEGSLQRKFVGAHVSISGGLWKSVEEAVELRASSFAMFLKSQRQWASKPLKLEDAEKFKKACQEHGFNPMHIVPHGSYLMNCGSPKDDVLQKSRDMLTDELKRCESLGLALFNFHPGSTCGEISVEESIKRIAESINLSLDQTKYVIAVIENMSCQGNTIGGKFEELRSIIDQVNDKSRVGICLDTCHAFAAGFDIATEKGYEKMMFDFENIVGLKYLKALHINDSKGAVGCHLDRHENIGKGKIGLEGFRRIMNDPRLNGLPMVLETPYGDYAKEIKTLNSLVKMG